MKCRNCDGTMRYDVASYCLVCDFCGSKRPLHKPEEEFVSEERDFISAMRDASSDWGIQRRAVSCKQCGAVMLYDADQMSGMCPYCGSAIVLGAEELNCGIAPSGIIPFKTTKEEVEQNYYKWNKFALWSPESFRKGKVLGNLVGVYVPFWTFDADTVTTYSGDFGRTVTHGDSETTKWDYRTGMVDAFIDDVSVCASKRFINNKKLNQVVRFTPEDIQNYTPDALLGFAAEKYTINIDEAWEMAKKSSRKKIEIAAKKREFADCYRDLKLSTEYDNIKFRYFLFPVWLAACPYKGKTYYVVASGLDNRGLCDRPVSVWKMVILGVILLSFFMIPMVSYIIMLIISLIMQH